MLMGIEELFQFREFLSDNRIQIYLGSSTLLQFFSRSNCQLSYLDPPYQLCWSPLHPFPVGDIIFHPIREAREVWRYICVCPPSCASTAATGSNIVVDGTYYTTREFFLRSLNLEPVSMVVVGRPHGPSLTLPTQLPSKEWSECQPVFEQPTIYFPNLCHRGMSEDAGGAAGMGVRGGRSEYKGALPRDLLPAPHYTRV